MAKAKRGFTFDYIDVRKPNYSKHNLSHDHLAAMGSGYLVPLWWTNAVPGDVFKCSVSGFMRLLALSSPMLQREDIKLRAFKVPWRILADRKDLDKAFAGDKNGEHIDFPFMNWRYDDLSIGSLADYLGLPLPYQFNNSTKAWEKISEVYVDTDLETNMFAPLAYHRIYHDHFRNEETENQWLDVFEQHYSDLDGVFSDDPLADFDSDAPFGLAFSTLHKVGWERDYFTSALSSSQRGSQVQIPLIGSAPIKADGNPNPQVGKILAFNNDGEAKASIATSDSEIDSILPDPTGQNALYVDGSSFSGIGAIALRMAMNLQAFLERNNVSGYRMIGNILAHFGVRSSNQLHDEAEYLGGISAPITISAVTQTSATETNGTPQGTQVGQGLSSFSNFLFSTRVEEPSIIMVVGYITAKTSYSQGLARKWSIRNYLDLYWPEFQSVGEQEILNKEIYFDFRHGQDPEEYNEGVWAYQSRYAEYKYEPDTIAGEFRTSLSYWHQSRLFNELPEFNDDFVKANPSDRVFALDSSTYPRQYLGEFYFDCQAVRPMDKYAVSRLW